MTESVVLALAGGALGLLCAWLVRDLLVDFTARFTPRAVEITIDRLVLTFAIGVSVLTGLLFGVMPVVLRRAELTGGLGADVSIEAGRRRLGARNVLIITQVAISFVLLVGAGLLVRSFDQTPAGRRGIPHRSRSDGSHRSGLRECDARRLAPCVLPVRAREGLGGAGLESAAFGLTVPLDQVQPFPHRLHRRGRETNRPPRAAASRLQAGIAGVFPDDRHDARERPFLHRRRQRDGAAGGDCRTCRWHVTCSAT